MDGTRTVMAISRRFAVVQNAAAGSYFKGVLLLLGGALHKVLVTHDLQPEEPAGDGAGPHEKEDADDQKARPLEGTLLGVWVRLRMAWTAAVMSSVSDVRATGPRAMKE